MRHKETHSNVFSDEIVTDWKKSMGCSVQRGSESELQTKGFNEGKRASMIEGDENVDILWSPDLEM